MKISVKSTEGEIILSFMIKLVLFMKFSADYNHSVFRDFDYSLQQNKL